MKGNISCLDSIACQFRCEITNSMRLKCRLTSFKLMLFSNRKTWVHEKLHCMFFLMVLSVKKHPSTHCFGPAGNNTTTIGRTAQIYYHFHLPRAPSTTIISPYSTKAHSHKNSSSNKRAHNWTVHLTLLIFVRIKGQLAMQKTSLIVCTEVNTGISPG